MWDCGYMRNIKTSAEEAFGERDLQTDQCS